MTETAFAKSALSVAVLGVRPQDGPYRHHPYEHKPPQSLRRAM